MKQLNNNLGALWFWRTDTLPKEKHVSQHFVNTLKNLFSTNALLLRLCLFSLKVVILEGHKREFFDKILRKS